MQANVNLIAALSCEGKSARLFLAVDQPDLPALDLSGRLSPALKIWRLDIRAA